jgi:hypothetical protein
MHNRLDVASLERVLGRPVNSEEEYRIEQWEKGKALQEIQNFFGWEVVLEILQSYVLKALKDLAETDPSQEQDVRAQQAVAFAANRLYKNFRADVDRAIKAAKSPPRVVLEQLKHKTSGLPLGL